MFMTKGKTGAVPVTKYESEAAVTDEMSSGSTLAVVRSSISTSMVKTSPAMGALKMPAMAPDAPHPMSTIKVRWSMWKMRPRLEPMAEPVRTMGASAPSEPPMPMVMELASIEVHMWWLLSRPFRCEMA